jgi:hypothetical protein
MIYDYSIKRKAGLSISERIERQSIPICECGCLIWLGYTENGYGRITIDGRNVLAHRASYEAVYGLIPSGKCALHKCDIPSCVNPDHIFLGTQTENNADRDAKNRGSVFHGSAHPNAKLTEDDVRMIRASNASQYDLATMYGVHQSHISDIVTRKAWNHLGE